MRIFSMENLHLLHSSAKSGLAGFFVRRKIRHKAIDKTPPDRGGHGSNLQKAYPGKHSFGLFHHAPEHI